MREQDRGYWRMVDRWQAIFAQPLSDAGKQKACLGILRDYVSQRAVSHIRHTNPRLRFYADMVALRSDLFPMFAVDSFGRVVIWPLYQIVDDWVRENNGITGC